MSSVTRHDSSFEEEHFRGPAESIRKLYSQIRHISKLDSKSSETISPSCVGLLRELEISASQVIDQFEEQKKKVSEHFDRWLIPTALDILDVLLFDSQELKKRLQEKVKGADQVTSREWDEEARQWAHLYSRWNGGRVMTAGVLEAVVDKTTHLINKDIQVIKDYQTQSLSQLSPASDGFRNVEKRLERAIEAPMKQLMSLRCEAEEQTSLEQALDWVANLQERRENYFEMLLMKIDHVMKDLVDLEDDSGDWVTNLEMEWELVFMESELSNIEEHWIAGHFEKDEDKEFLVERLKGLSEHLMELSLQRLPFSLHSRIREVEAAIIDIFNRLDQ